MYAYYRDLIVDTLREAGSLDGCYFALHGATAREPGARLVLTYGLLRSPRSTAFFASSPAASITEALS